jgi:hypothetical protein
VYVLRPPTPSVMPRIASIHAGLRCEPQSRSGRRKPSHIDPNGAVLWVTVRGIFDRLGDTGRNDPHEPRNLSNGGGKGDPVGGIGEPVPRPHSATSADPLVHRDRGGYSTVGTVSRGDKRTRDRLREQCSACWRA